MREVLRTIARLLFCIIMAPGYAIFGVLECWAEAFDTIKRPNSIYRLLVYGSLTIPIYKFGIQVVCRKEVIWEADRVFILDIPSALLRMKVHTWDIKDGKLWIKVCINERLLKKLDEEQITKNIQGNNPGNKQN